MASLGVVGRHSLRGVDGLSLSAKYAVTVFVLVAVPAMGGEDAMPHKTRNGLFKKKTHARESSTRPHSL